MKNLNGIEYLVGNKNISKRSVLPYDNNICDFLGDLSDELNSNSESKNYPDIKTLAFWCRRQNINNLKKKFLSNETRVGLGLIFHITPSNIPTNFAYSLIFGLITGNSNIIKVPTQNFLQVGIICKSINKLLKKKHKSICKMISIVRYSDNDIYTKKISSICSARLIWGGDNSIKNIRNFPLNQRALDIAFADRYSFCVINTSEVIKLGKKEMKRLAERFYNDTYLVDQNACSSPHLVLWLGKKVDKARNKFWKHLHYHVNKNYTLTETASLDKYTQLCSHILSLNNLKKYELYNNFIYTTFLKNLDKNIHELRGKWGFFYEYNINDLNKMKNYINNKYQTLTYFGLNKSILKNFIIKNQLEGIDRIVPIGQALDISFFWDGYDLNKILSRVVDIK
tara:strand:- start:82 stop:1269 length:1188 start_codon:yes stop_codon:yes gene_type:complete